MNTHKPPTATPANESSTHDRWERTSEHVWRAEALVHLLGEVFCDLENNTPVCEKPLFHVLRPHHLRLVTDMLREELNRAVEGIGELEPKWHAEDPT